MKIKKSTKALAAAGAVGQIAPRGQSARGGRTHPPPPPPARNRQLNQLAPV